MKKLLFLFVFPLSYLILSYWVLPYLIYGQSINDDYKLARRYRELAIEAHEAGDYEQSIEFAKKSQEHSDKYMAPLSYARADAALRRARERGFDKSKTDMYNEASQSLTNADRYLKSEDYSNSLIHSKNVIALANSMGITVSNPASGPGSSYAVAFPRNYIVVERTKNTDSLWRIASYDFIYGSGYLWRRIYEANKDKIKDPNIIRKGQRLTIPSLKGEKREGTYNSNNTYGNIKDYKKD